MAGGHITVSRAIGGLRNLCGCLQQPRRCRTAVAQQHYHRAARGSRRAAPTGTDPASTSIEDHQRHSSRKCPPIGRVSPPATTRSSLRCPNEGAFRRPPHNLERARHPVAFCGREQLPPGPLRRHLQVHLDMLGRQRLGGCPERDLACERQACEAQQILILDKDAVQRRLGVRGQPRRGIDRGQVFADRVERHDDALDGSAHCRAPGRPPCPDASRANSAALAAKASRRAAIRRFSVPSG